MFESNLKVAAFQRTQFEYKSGEIFGRILLDLGAPATGGVRLGTSVDTCTFGFAAWRLAGPNPLGVVTASHCTETLFGPDNTEFYAYHIYGSVPFAKGDIDPKPHECTLHDDGCRASDAALGFYYPAIAADAFWVDAVGRISQVETANDGSTEKHTGSPRHFLITDKSRYFIKGQLLDKVGHATAGLPAGWRKLTTATCIQAIFYYTRSP